MTARSLPLLAVAIAVAALSLAAPRPAQGQDPCTQIDPPPPPECFGVPSVDPDGGSAGPFSVNTGGHSVVFTVWNTGMQSDGFSITCSGSSNVTCTSTSVTSVFLDPGTSVDVTAYFTVGAAGMGTITLTASKANGPSDAGYYNVQVGTLGVAVTPDGAAAPSQPANTGGHSLSYTIQNTGSIQTTFTLTCSAVAPVTCGTVTPSSVTVAGLGSTGASVAFSVGAPGTGTLTLTASGNGVSDAGSYSVPVSSITAFVPSSVTGGLFIKDNRYLLQETANAYNTVGQLTQLTDPRGMVTNYLYGGNANNAFLTKVTQVHDGSGTMDLVTDIAYDGDGFVSSIKDPAGSFRYFIYDLYGRLRQVKNNSGTVVKAYGYSYSRTSGNAWTFQSSSPNAIVDSTFVQQTPTLKTVVSTQYIDGLGSPIQTVVLDGTNSVVSATQYDAMGRVWRTWKPFSRTGAGYDPNFVNDATTSYNTYHSTSTAKPYAETQYTPDALARVKQETPEYIGTSPSALVLHAYGVDAVAHQSYTEVTDESGKKTRSYSDVFGNAVKAMLGYGATEGTTTSFAYNVLGQRTQVTDPRGFNTTYTRDTRGLLTARANPDAGTVSSKYDKGGNLRFSQDANQAAAGTAYFVSYDFAGRQLTSGLGAATFSTLDPDATATLETTQGNWLVVRAYDARPSTAAFPWSLFSAQITPLTLNNVAGRLAAVASKSGAAWQVTLFSYDADGQLATRYIYTQDNPGATVLTALNTTVTYLRDLRGALTERDLVVGSSMFYHWYDYDNRGLLTKTYASTTPSKPGSADVTDTYRPSGQPQDFQFLGGPLVPIRYTIRGLTEQIGDPASTAYPFSAHYVYNPNGTVLQSEFYSAGSPAPQKRYRYDFPSYDALNRLKSADYSGWNGTAWAATLAYDLAGINYDVDGNLTALQRYRDAGTLIDNLTYTYPAGSNRLSSVTDAVGATAEPWDAETGSFTYDPNGNIATAPAPYSLTAVGYNYQNLPVSLMRSGVTTIYRYDQAGERITKQVGTGNTEVYLRDGATTLGVFTVNGSGTPVSWYFNLVWEDRIVGRQPNTGNRNYYHFDMLGSTRAVTQGVIVAESYDFEPWGLLMSGRTLGSGTKEGFTAKEQDTETGLDYFEARYYMPALGRWTSIDPAADDMSQWSPYNYAYDNPVLNTDPDGRQAGAGFGLFFAQHPVMRDHIVHSFVARAKQTWHSFTTVSGLVHMAEGAMTMARAGSGDPVAIFQVGRAELTSARETVAKWNSGDAGKGDVIGGVVEGLVEIGATAGAGEVLEAAKAGEAVEGLAPEAGVRMGGDAAESAPTHGNSLDSNLPQHRYEISETETGDVVKTGISGEPLNANGTSGRANGQVNRLNRAEGAGKYQGAVRETGIPGRRAALQSERAATGKLAAEGNSLRLQKRPPPPPRDPIQ